MVVKHEYTLKEDRFHERVHKKVNYFHGLSILETSFQDKPSII